MYAVRPSSAAAALLLVALLSSAVAGPTTDGSVARLSYQDEESRERPYTSVEQATDANFVLHTDSVASNEASLGATDSGAGDPEDDHLRQKIGALSNDVRKFIVGFSKTNDEIKKLWNLLSEKDGLKVKDSNLLNYRIRNLLMKCVKKFGAKCVKNMPEYESGRLKREALKSIGEYEVVKSVDLEKKFENSSPSAFQTKSSLVNIAKEESSENESVTQYVFRELQNLLYENRSDLQDESMEVKLVDVADVPLSKPMNSEFYSGFEAVSNPISTDRHKEYIRTTPQLKSTTTQPARQNSISTSETSFSKFHTSNPKNRLSEFLSKLTTIPSTTESGINFTSATESHPYKSTHSSGRYPRSTTFRGSSFQRNGPYPFRTPPAVYYDNEVTRSYGDYVVDYITADHETSNPRQTLKELLSEDSIREPWSGNVQYEIVNSDPDGSYDDSEFPLYEYFVISEHPESEPSYLSLPTYQDATYQPEKQVYEETEVPVQLVTGNRISTASSTRFISTTPLSNDDLYEIIKERIPASTAQPQSFNVVETPVKTLQQQFPKISTESQRQLISPGNYESSHLSTPSYFLKASVPNETTKSLIVNIQNSDDHLIRPVLQSEPATSSEATTPDSIVVTNPYRANNLLTANVPAVTTPITEPTTSQQELALTTTLQDVITAIENQLGTTATTVEEPLRTDVPMQVTVTSDEITVSGPDTQSISTLLYELRKPILSTRAPFEPFIRPNIDAFKPVEVDPMQFAEFTSSVKKPLRKPSITTLFSGYSPYATSIQKTFQSVSKDVYRTSAPVQTEELTPVTEEEQMQVSNSYGIPEYLIKSELLGDKLKPGFTATHIFGIPKEILESELMNDAVEAEEQESSIKTSASNTGGKEPNNLVDQYLVRPLEEDLPYNGIPLSMLNAELRRTLPEHADGFDLKFEHNSRDKTQKLSTPTSTFYVVEGESPSSTIPFLTTEKAQGSYFPDILSMFTSF